LPCQINDFDHGNARFTGLVVDIHLQADIEVRQLFRSLIAQSLRYLKAVDRMDPVEAVGNSLGLVALQVPDEVPAQVVASGPGYLFEAFLDKILRKITLSGRRRLNDAPRFTPGASLY
jgi:hypothetical protein